MVDPATGFPESITRRLAQLYRADEERTLAGLIEDATFPAETMAAIQRRAADWVNAIRAAKKPLPGIADLLSHFGLDSREGVALMCLAEALLRVPDTATADALIRDKLGGVDFEAKLGAETPWYLRAASWTLNVTGQMASANDPQMQSPRGMLGMLGNKLGQGALREAIRQAMRWLGDAFVLGTDIEAALARAGKFGNERLRFSFDMLGEAARTAEDAEHYMTQYLEAVRKTGAANRDRPSLAPSGISVKLSALHPRYEATQIERVRAEMLPRLIALTEAAAAEDIFLIIDAEEADRLLLSLDIMREALARAKLRDWRGFGFAVQAYSKRAPAVIEAAAWMAEEYKRPLTVRLIKGAYWDTEIKRAQERGWSDFPVFTRKTATDVSYWACARKLLAHGVWLNPVFGSHNALTIAGILALAPDPKKIEFQRLHGMGEELFARLDAEGLRTCVYAPVGQHKVLLSYLVRRLLENGANSSFVNQITDPSVPVTALTADPVEKLRAAASKRHPAVTLPANLYLPERMNSAGLDLTDPAHNGPLQAAMEEAGQRSWQAAPVIGGIVHAEGAARAVINPALNSKRVGLVFAARPEHVNQAFASARKAFPEWSRRSGHERALILERLAGRMEDERAVLMALLVREGGKTVNDALAEVREAVDFCRYYAARARADFVPKTMPGPSGERNTLTLHGRGVFACISPWNFPLAIFLGQVAAALAAGNCVIAKPASLTPLVAAHAVALAHQAGVPGDVLHFLPGNAEIGAALASHPDTAGVAMTGGGDTARRINRSLASREGPIAPLIAETGGQNAMIADSTALPEQLIDDVLTSAFRSAGQRCSALRLLCLPRATADKIMAMLAAALREMKLGDPALLRTDIGPVIDHTACGRLREHVSRLKQEAREIYTMPLPGDCVDGSFFSPQIWEIPGVSFLTEEVFGPILHVLRYEPQELSALIAAINATGFGLTGGVQSRIDGMAAKIGEVLHVGNLYVNRNMIGAVVGTQPFGGEGLSGTGPKAGGPHYLPRFALERVTAVNTAAMGGNTALLAAAAKD